MSAPGDVRRALEGVVGPSHVLRGELTDGYRIDWTGRFQGETPAVVRPADTREVAEVLRLCRDAGVAVVPQGGNTGLVGGGVPLDGEVVLSLRRLDHLGPVDPGAGQVTVGAGATLAALQHRAAAAGLRFGVDLAARDSATVGGMVATNAGGLHVVRFGPMRRQLRGIEAVLADGSVVRHLGGLEKDNTGYDLAGLLCGSEGTLGVVTAVRLQLVPRAGATVTALLGFDDFAAALDAAVHLRRTVEGLEAAEVLFAAGVDLVAGHLGTGHPFPSRPPVYLLVEAAGRDDPTEGLAAALADAASTETAVAAGGPDRDRLWRYREAHTEAISTLGVPHKLDVALPLEQLPAFADGVCTRVEALGDGVRCWLFGHALDGNLHVNVTGVAPDDERVDDAVLRLVADHGGSISAEHGIGRAKRRWLHLNRSTEELAAMAAIKRALDPGSILNPGVLLPPGTSGDAG